MHRTTQDGFIRELGALREKARTEGFFSASRDSAVAALRKDRLSAIDLAALLSPDAALELEALAVRAQAETLRHFGKGVQLFAPLYLANYCTNRCVYCGFHAGTGIARTALEPEDVEQEARALAATGLRRVLCLTGDAPKRTGAAYIAACVGILARHFPSVGIEVQALTEDEYRQVCHAGADSMTMFQETYDPELYESLHPAGPKRDFAFRLEAPQRAALAGMRGITLGALLGLGGWRYDAFMLAMHATWLSQRFPHLELSISLPRIRPVDESGGASGRNREGGWLEPGAGSSGAGWPAADGSRNAGKASGPGPGFTPSPVKDKDFVQALTALRCFLPHMGITLSSRESAFLRDKLIPLGVTRVSAGVRTSVGGYAAAPQETGDSAFWGTEGLASRACASGSDAHADKPVQFVIDDTRSVKEMEAALLAIGYQPVFADWLLPEKGNLPLARGLRIGLALVEESCAT